jgi:hypothetical protein
VFAVQKAAEIKLAWALIDVVKPHLNIHERDIVFVTIGAGDTFAAIRQLLGLVAAKQIALRPHLVHLCATWLDAYVGHDQEQCLRRVIERLLAPNSFQAAIPMRMGHPLTAQHRKPSVVNGRLRQASVDHGSVAGSPDECQARPRLRG